MIETDRRGFLFGSLASLVAATTVTPLHAIEIITQPSQRWRRIVATFDALDRGDFTINVTDVLDRRLSDRELQRLTSDSGYEVRWAQLERGAFPTSYIPTNDKPALRDREIAGIGKASDRGSMEVDIDDIFVHRKSPATIFDDDRQEMLVMPPNTPRRTKRGLLIESASENCLLYSNRPQSQNVLLVQGRWVFSCYVKGEVSPHIEIVASDGRAFAPVVREEYLS